MRKSLIYTIITLSLSSVVVSTHTYADSLITANNNNDENKTAETYMLPGIGAGAASGAVVAGPVGFIVGGIIGAIIGSNQEVTDYVEADIQANNSTDYILANETKNSSPGIISKTPNYKHSLETPPIFVAQLENKPLNNRHHSDGHDEIANILTENLSLDIYFRSGSTNIESFYPARLTAIATLMKTLNTIDLHLDGYTDRRGNKAQNIALANKRIDKVRQQLINAGIDDNRILSKAFGEMKMVSDAGDLEGYTFDRKVVIRFKHRTADSLSTMVSDLSDKVTAQP